MRYLVDTHILIWHGENNPALKSTTLTLLNDPANELFISHACLWEMAIKVSLGKLKLASSVEQIGQELGQNGFTLLPFDLAHYGVLSTLPFHHNDPFDRMMIAQAICEQLEVITYDDKFKLYPVKLN
ncbi:MAG: type II toxin-antitoxin system VapC family toxin [Saprospiraceae bacterium]